MNLHKGVVVVSPERRFIVLEVAMQTTIKTLHAKGYNITQISRLVQADRKTIRKILQSQERGEEQVVKQPHPSVLDEYREFIEIQLGKELSIQRIYQDLATNYQFQGSYSCVRDYVRKLKPSIHKAYMVLHTLPGEESQVDFGYIGTIPVDGKPKKAWVFVMSLSYSRYMYVQIVFNQSVKTFIHCHVQAFRYFQGVPETVKIDNLKAGIVDADFYEPVTQRTYASFAAHYGFWAQPCRIYTPTDKGKVEANVKYVKDNCFKGRGFADVAEAEAYVAKWLKETANVRIHGTTHQVPALVFREVEQSKLRPLPSEDFVFSRSVRAVVYPNCHLAYAGNNYSVPSTYIHCEVDVIEINQLLRIYYEGSEIAIHTLCQDKKGEYITNHAHYPESKTITLEEIKAGQKQKMTEIGPHALRFFEAFYNKPQMHKYEYRYVSGILSLRQRFHDAVIDDACRRALYYNTLTYGTVKRICEKGLIALPIDNNTSFINEEPTAVARALSQYDSMSSLGVIAHE
jgi:transposase